MAMQVKCWPPWGLMLPPLQSLSKLLKEIGGGRRENGTVTWAPVQAAGAKKRGFSQTNEANAGLISRDFLNLGLSLEGKGGQRWSSPGVACGGQLLSAFSQGSLILGLSLREEGREDAP